MSSQNESPTIVFDGQPLYEGTVIWHPEVYRGDVPVTDKHGVEQHPRALVYADDAKVLADAVIFLARRCEEQGFYSPVTQPVVQKALEIAVQVVGVAKRQADASAEGA